MAQYASGLYLSQDHSRAYYASKCRSSALFHVCPLPSHTACDESLVPLPFSETLSPGRSRTIICFREDDVPFPEKPVQQELGDYGVRTTLELQYSPWAMSMMKGFGNTREGSGRPPGGNKGGDDGGHGSGGGDDDEDDHIFLLPVFTLAFAAIHLGYCFTVWVRNESLDHQSFRTGLGLFCLLGLAAIRLRSGAGLDSYVLGLGASLGVMFWTGERFVVKREGGLAGITALLAASLAVMFTRTLYDNV